MKAIKSFFLTTFVCCLVFLCGCVPVKSAFRYYRDYQPIGDYTLPQSFEVGADTDTFDIDDVSLNIAIGIYRLDMDSDYYNCVSRPFEFGIYICDEKFAGYRSEHSVWDESIQDISNVENHIFIKNIDQREALSEEYGYAVERELFCAYERYNHIEQINISSELFDSNEGSIVITVVMFSKLCDNGGEPYYVPQQDAVFYIKLNYVKVGSDKIEIVNFQK